MFFPVWGDSDHWYGMVMPIDTMSDFISGVIMAFSFEYAKL